MSQPKVRVDKWLWAVRLYKTRTAATDACKQGDIRLEDKPLKPSALLLEGMSLSVNKNGFHYRIIVRQLIEKRVGAPIAVTCYEDKTPAEELAKYEQWFAAQSGKPAFRERGTGRPTKKERREIDHFTNDVP